MTFWLKIALIVLASMLSSIAILWVSASTRAEFTEALPGFGIAWCFIFVFMGGGYLYNARFPADRS